MRNTLSQLHTDIDARVDSIRAEHNDWLCRMGCDGCCRRLAAVPRLTEAEWIYLREGLTELSEEQLKEVGQAVTALANRPSRPIVCPLLDQTAGACRVYAHRPVACRTYGFYLERGQGLYCRDIESRVVAGEWSEVVWGNQDAVDRRLAGLGDVRGLTEWFSGIKDAFKNPLLPFQLRKHRDSFAGKITP